MRRVAAVLVTLLVPQGGGAQSRAADLIAAARTQISARQLDSAAALLRAALDTANHPTAAERENAFVWRAILDFLSGNDSLTRAAFRQALALDTALTVAALASISPRLADLFAQEKEAATRKGLVYLSRSVDEPPRRVSGPPVAYPPALLHGHVAGLVEVAVIIDTLGRAEPASIEVLTTPDTGLDQPVKQMVAASAFTPGRRKGSAVRVMIQLAVDVRPPRLNATELVTAARAQLAANRTDSAFTLLAIALDTAITRPTQGERAYALLTRGIAHSRSGARDSGAADLRDGLALYRDLTTRGVDLAPFLRRLADSVGLRSPGTKRPAAAMEGPAAVGGVDEQPALLSHPAIRYPPEMQALRVGGTVLVEALLDTTGHVEPGSARIARSPNHVFDREALRVVRGSVYRPARIQGRAVRVTIQQAVTFVPY